MATERHSAKRYGVRYGRKLRDKIGKLEHERHITNKCPYCHYSKLERPSAGIWHCQKCNAKFTGRAYHVGKKLEGAAATKFASDAIEVPQEIVSEVESSEIEEHSSEEETPKAEAEE